MSPLIETLLERGVALDALGIVGLCMVALAAVRLTRVHHSWGGTMLTCGALSLLAGRLYLLLSPYLITNDVLYAIGPLGISLTYAIPPLLLTFGLAGIVWGLWAHERWYNEETL